MQSIDSRLKSYKKQLLTYDEAVWLLRKEGIPLSEIKRRASYKWRDSDVISKKRTFTYRNFRTTRKLPPELMKGLRKGNRIGWGIVLSCIVPLVGVRYLSSYPVLQIIFVLMGGVAAIAGCVYSGFILKLLVFWPRYGGREFVVNSLAVAMASYFIALIGAGMVIMIYAIVT